jgi:hypothetical protein
MREQHPDAPAPDHMLDRLQNLRSIVPVFAQELAESRRQAARLRLENAGLRERIAVLEAVAPAPRATRAAAG